VEQRSSAALGLLSNAASAAAVLTVHASPACLVSASGADALNLLKASCRAKGPGPPIIVSGGPWMA